MRSFNQWQAASVLQWSAYAEGYIRLGDEMATAQRAIAPLTLHLKASIAGLDLDGF